MSSLAVSLRGKYRVAQATLEAADEQDSQLRMSRGSFCLEIEKSPS